MVGPQDWQGEESSLEIRGEREAPVKERSFGEEEVLCQGFMFFRFMSGREERAGCSCQGEERERGREDNGGISAFS